MTRSVACLAAALVLGALGPLGALGALGALAKDEIGSGEKPAPTHEFIAPHADTRERAMALDIRVRARMSEIIALLDDPDTGAEAADDALASDLQAFAARLRLSTGLLRKRAGSNDAACAYLGLAQALEADATGASRPADAHARLLALGAAHDALVDAALFAYDVEGAERDSTPGPYCFGKPLNRA